MAYDGQEIAGYKLLKKIGEGGMGQVFLAEQLRLRRQVAIKLVYLDVKGEDARPAPADELTREAEALMALEHPHILSLYDAGRSGDTAYLVMPYIPEGSLQDALRPGPRQQLQLPLSPTEALLYIEQASAALQYAHDRNFIHRDVKPANFLIRSLSSGKSGTAPKRLHLFLADFGLSKFLAYSSNTTHLSGTPTYMAPEQFQGHATPASDQYSLAILFFYLLTGDLPYRGSPVELMFHHLNDTPPSPAARVEGIPAALASVVQRGIAKTPEERYPSVASMTEAARDALIAAGLAVAQDSFPAIAAVRSSDLTEQPTQNKSDVPLAPTTVLEPSGKQPAKVEQNPVLAPTAVLGASEVTSAPTVITDDLVTSKGSLNISDMPTQAKSGESSLPTIAIDGPKQPPKSPRDERPFAEQRPPRRGLTVALIALAAVIVLGAVFGGGVLLQLGPFHKSTSTAQSTQTAGPTPTATVPTTPTAVPTATASAVLKSILAQKPTLTVDMSAGDAQWDGPFPINPKTNYSLYTPGDRVTFQNATITFNAQTFQPPLAVAVDLNTTSNPMFAILLDTSDGSGAHLYYRLQLTDNAPPQAAHSSDNSNYTSDASGTTGNTSWANGQSHKLFFVLDGTRLLFYFDGQALIDTQIPQPLSSTKLSLVSSGIANVTGIVVYPVPQS